MNKFEFVLSGKSPLVMNSGSDFLAYANRKFKTLDERNPCWFWTTKLGLDKDKFVTIPSENVIACLARANGKLKSRVATSFFIRDENLVFSNNGQRINIFEFLENLHESFTDQRVRVRKHGFDLLVKRAIIGETKIIRVLPIFKNWELRGTIVSHESEGFLKEVFDNAGEQVGLGDFRLPQGFYGRFGVSLRDLKCGLNEACDKKMAGHVMAREPTAH